MTPNRRHPPGARMRHHHLQPVNAKDFTARSYQEQLFEMARQENTVVCLNTGSGKTFIAVMLIKELAEDVRKDFDAGGKRTFFVVPKVTLVSQQAAVVRQHTDLRVKEYIGADSVDRWSAARWNEEFRDAQVLVMTAQILLDILQHGFMKLSQINLIIFDECHHTTKNNPYAQIMRLFTPEVCALERQPRILGLSASLVNEHVKDADDLEKKIRDLERMMHCKAATAADFGEVEAFSTKPEEVIDQYDNPCDVRVDDATIRKGVALYFQVDSILRPALDFIEDFGDGETPPAGVSQPTIATSSAGARELLMGSLSPPKTRPPSIKMHSPAVREQSPVVVADCITAREMTRLVRCALLEVLDILVDLGVWCAGCAAKNQLLVFTNMAEKKPFMHKDARGLLDLATTHFRMTIELVERAKENVADIDDLMALGSPKVRRLVHVLHSYKPAIEFEMAPMAATAASKPFRPRAPSFDKGSDSDSSYDDGDISCYDSDSSTASDEQQVVFRQRVSQNVSPPVLSAAGSGQDIDEMPHLDVAQDLSICGIVFVQRRHAAMALHKYIEDICIHDLDLYFIRSGYVVGHGVASMSSAEGRMGVRKQEHALKQFRNRGSSSCGREVNLLIATSVIEEGVDVPKCNLVAMFDAIVSYRQYVQTKGRARAAKSKYYMFVERSKAARFECAIENYRRIEQLLKERCIERDLPTSEEILEHAEDVADILPPYMPVKEDGAPRVTMNSAISLINRYCARLPCDRYTRLSVTCIITKIREKGDTLFVATLQLPSNSSVKYPIEGIPMRTAKLAKMAAALEACKLLHQNGELDDHLLPLGKDVIKHPEIAEDYELEEEYAEGAKPGSSKRKQIYNKKLADVYTDQPVEAEVECYLYGVDMRFAAALLDTAGNDVGDRFISDEHPRGVGIIVMNKLPPIPVFPLFTRSGEEAVSIVDCGSICLSKAELATATVFHQFVFRNVLCIDKSIRFHPQGSAYSLIVVPTMRNTDGFFEVDWIFAHSIEATLKQSVLRQPSKDTLPFIFRKEHYADTVVAPSYRRAGQMDFFFVTAIRDDLTVTSSFPTAEYRSFDEYYRRKYGLQASEVCQPLLDVARTPGRLNLLTPRNINQKGMPLPSPRVRDTSGDADSGHRQRQQLVPEFCDIHPCPASLWRKIVCLPSALYRLNALLLCEEIRRRVASEASVGLTTLPVGFTYPPLDFSMPFMDDDEDDADDDGLVPFTVSNPSLSHGQGLSVDNSRFAPYYGNGAGTEEARDRFCVGCRRSRSPDARGSAGVEQDSTSRKPAPARKMAVCRRQRSFVSSGAGRFVSLDAEEGGGVEAFAGPSPALLLHALTTSGSNDFLNLERLETVGDSFLKFAVTAYLFCAYPDYHEGRLSYSRSKQVSNFNLYRLAKKKGFGEYILSAKFEPSENWLPPGYECGSSGRVATFGRGLSAAVAAAASKPANALEAGASSSSRAGCKPGDAALSSQRQRPCDQDVQQPYNVRMEQRLTDKSLADCAEALIGCYVITGGPQAARGFMSWLGLKVLPSRQLLLRSPTQRQGVRETVAVRLQQQAASRDDVKRHADGRPVPPSPLISTAPNRHAMLAHHLSGFDALEDLIGYKFQDRAYLLQAFTHASFSQNTVTDCYQRLEFLGDAVLDYVITRHMFEDKARFDPGQLTDLRSALVNNNIFAMLAVKWDFNKYLKHMSSELFDAIRKFVSHQKKNNDRIDIEKLLSDTPSSTLQASSSAPAAQSGDGEAHAAVVDAGAGVAEEVEIPKVLSDLFESVAGAIYLDSQYSLDTVWRVYSVLMREPLELLASHVPKAPVRELMELYPELIKFMDAEHTVDGKVRVTVNVVGKGSFSGVGRSRKNAKVACAKNALMALRPRGPKQAVPASL